MLEYSGKGGIVSDAVRRVASVLKTRHVKAASSAVS